MPVTIDGTNGITTPDLESAGPVTANGVTTSLYPLVSGTAVASTSGTSIDFTSIPSWVKRITVMFNGVRKNAGDIIQIQLGDSGGIETTGYVCSAQFDFVGNGYQSLTSGQPLNTGGAQAAAYFYTGAISIQLLGSNLWLFSGVITAEGLVCFSCAGKKTLSGTLDRVRITTVGGTAAFDAGSINILYE
jgi:hypothetical protein